MPPWIRNHLEHMLALFFLALLWFGIGQWIMEEGGWRSWNIFAFGSSMFFLGILCVWVGVGIPLSHFHDEMRLGDLRETFHELSGRDRMLMVLGVILLFFYFFIQCCRWAV